MIQTDNITLSMARMSERQEERFQGLQTVLSLMAKDGLTSGWKPIIKIYISKNKQQLQPKHRDYIFIAFDFVPGHDLRRVVRISKRVNTSHFRKFISLN